MKMCQYALKFVPLLVIKMTFLLDQSEMSIKKSKYKTLSKLLKILFFHFEKLFAQSATQSCDQKE